MRLLIMRVSHLCLACTTSLQESKTDIKGIRESGRITSCAIIYYLVIIIQAYPVEDLKVLAK